MPHKKNTQNMKPLDLDPCSNCLYGKDRNQHNIPGRVENFNRVLPKEAFGPKAVPKKPSGKKPSGKKPKKPRKPKKPKQPYKPKY